MDWMDYFNGLSFPEEDIALEQEYFEEVILPTLPEEKQEDYKKTVYGKDDEEN